MAEPFLFKAEDSVYDAQVFLFVGSRAQLLDHLLKTYGKRLNNRILKDAVGQMLEVVTNSKEVPGVKSTHYIVWMAAFADSPRFMSSLSHEVNHATFSILGGRYVDDEEAHCYYQDSLMFQFLTALGALKEKQCASPPSV